MKHSNFSRLYSKIIKIADTELSRVYWLDAIVAMIVAAVLALLICILVGRIRKKKAPLFRRIGWMMVASYLVFMFELAILSREPDSREGVFNFSIFSKGLSETQQIYDFLNVLFFIPLGIGLGMALYGALNGFADIMVSTILCFFCTCGIEFLQKTQGRGYFERADLEANVLGGVIGAVLGAVIAAVCDIMGNRQKKKRKKRK